MLTFAFCTYKRADRLEKLVANMRQQDCPMPFEILAINNNSPDNTIDVLERLVTLPGPTLRYVTETEQGIVPARNRAIEESMNSDILVFVDDDEIPLPGLLIAVCDAITNEGAQCVGGAIDIDFSEYSRPQWLDDELAAFLGALNHADTAFWIKDQNTPVWSGNIAYDVSIFRNNPKLRFDTHYNREGSGIGGGSDAIMFKTLISQNSLIRYRPDMKILHSVEPWKLKRRYFLKLHYLSGIRFTRHQNEKYNREFFGVPPFMVTQALKQMLKTISTFVKNGNTFRQAMNFTNALGMIVGSYLKQKDVK